MAIIFSYVIIVFVPVPYIRDMRDVYIATAMTTAHHKYLATLFFPKFVIDEVMSEKVDVVNDVSEKIFEKEIDQFAEATDSIVDGNEDIKLLEDDKTILSNINNSALSVTSCATISEINKKYSSKLIIDEGYKNNYKKLFNNDIFKVGSNDYNGNKVLVNNEDEEIVIVEVKTINYTGYLAIVGDPSRVVLKTTKYKDNFGQTVPDYLRTNDAILGINGSGFPDVDGSSVGGDVTGLCFDDGKAWGKYEEDYMSFGFDRDNNFIVGLFDNWEERNIRDAIQFKPAILIDGKGCITGNKSWGLQPRTAIGQDANGTVYMIVIDGRQVGYSIGATVNDVLEIFKKYGVINASVCDGGSSATMAYDGKMINIPTTPMKEEGRYVPNAFIVKKIKKEN